MERSENLNTIPIKKIAHDLAIISSIRHEAGADIVNYAEIIVKSFETSGIDMEVLFADNTLNFNNREVLRKIKDLFNKSGIEFEFFNEPNPGKIHGLNLCLTHVKSKYVMSVDVNKFPGSRTLLGLYERIVKQDSDLISCQIGIGHQNWNAGPAYIGRRDYFLGFPEIINDDEYSQLIAMARGGKFEIAHGLPVYDFREETFLPFQRIRRRARQLAARDQLKFLTIIDKGNKYDLGREQAQLKKSTLSLKERCLRVFGYLRYFPKNKILTHVVNSYFRLLERKGEREKLIRGIKAYKEEIKNNPRLCSWEQ